MKKGLLIATLAAASVAGYMIMQQSDSSNTNYNPLDYIPSDTAIFSAQLEPFPIRDYLRSAPNPNTPEQSATLEDLEGANDKRINFFLDIVEQYQASITDADLFVKTFGLADNIRAYFYTLGILPVLKIEVNEPQAIWDLLDRAEQKSGYVHQQKQIQNTAYRSYLLTDETDSETLEVVVAHHNGLLTITLNSSFNEQDLLSSALGLTKAEQPISTSGILEEIIQKHNFNGQNVAFLNHQQIITGLTTDGGNQLAKQLTKYIKQSGEENPFALLKTQECAADFASIAKNWPRTVFGYTELSVTSKASSMEVSTVIESNNQAIINALQSIRGHIPSYTMDFDKNVFALALGLDVNQLTTAVTTILTDLQTPKYQCAPLQDIQFELAQQAQSSLGALGMISGMANGIKGVSFALLDYSMSLQDGKQVLQSADALFTYSADNPMMFFNSLKMFTPELQQIELKEDGSAVDLSQIINTPESMHISPQMAIKGKHLVIYSGIKGEQQANKLSDEILAKNGLLNFSADINKWLTPLITATELSGETFPEEALFLKNYNMRMRFTVDVTDNGITFDSWVNNKTKN